MHCLLCSPRRFLASVAVAASLAVPAVAAELEATSRIDSVTNLPDGATVTRLIKIDLAAGDHTVLARDFPLSLDPSSLRVEGEGVRLTIGAIDAGVPRTLPPANLPEIDQRIEKLRDRRAELDGAVAAAQARRQLPSISRRILPAPSATRGQRGPSPNGARPSRLWPRKSPRRTARCAKQK